MSDSYRTVEYENWQAVRETLLNYSRRPASRRSQLLFRGVGNASWSLKTTLDRKKQFPTDEAREVYVSQLLDAFREQIIDLQVTEASDLEGEAVELLARHHGLPSPLLDWTRSPYIAAYFAYSNALEEPGVDAAVWVLDRARIPPRLLDEVELISEKELLRYNRRALYQRAVFLRVPTGQQTLEEMLGVALVKMKISVKDAQLALSDLDQMTINDTYLFGDLDAAARTAHLNVSHGMEDGDYERY